MTFKEFEQRVRKSIQQLFHDLIQSLLFQGKKIVYDDIYNMTNDMEKKILICENGIDNLDIVLMYQYILKKELHEVLVDDIDSVSSLTKTFVYTLATEIEQSIIDMYAIEESVPELDDEDYHGNIDDLTTCEDEVRGNRYFMDDTKKVYNIYGQYLFTYEDDEDEKPRQQ